MPMLTRCVRCNRVFRTSTWLLTSVLRVRAIIHRPNEGVSSRAARPTEAFLSRGSALEHTIITRNRQVIVEVIRKKKRERDRGERGRTSSGIDPEPRDPSGRRTAPRIS